MVRVMLIGLTLLGIGIICGIYYKRWRMRQQLASSRAQGRKGEEDAAKWLKDFGFERLESQTERNFHYFVNGMAHNFRVRPDFIAHYQGQAWLIEVKTGKSASPSEQSTRRQIREYAQLWPHHRYALLDATQGVLHEVSFRTSTRQHLTHTWYQFNTSSMLFTLLLTLVIGMGIGVLIGLFLASHS